MRRQVVTTLGVVTLCMASYAATFMQVKTDDGKTVSFDVDHVTEVVFDTTSSDHEYVDLGLPSGTLWATCNIGATKPEEFGDYFAWGETEPKEVYDWSTYKYAKALGPNKLDSLTKYCLSSDYGIIDGLSSLLPDDDAATVNWGKEWRMPTEIEVKELVEECYWVWTSSYNGTGVRGHVVYKTKNDFDKGKVSFKGADFESQEAYSVADAHIFLPFVSFRCGAEDDVFQGHYWTSNCSDEEYAVYLRFYTNVVGYDYANFRFVGSPIRAVRSKK